MLLAYVLGTLPAVATTAMTLHPKNYRYSHYFFCSRQHQETGVTYGSGYVSKPAEEFSLLSCANLQHKIQDTTYQASEDDNTR